MSNIEKKSIISNQSLNQKLYLESLLDEAYKLELIDINCIQKVKLECLNLLKMRVDRYNGVDSNSISKDKAESIMESNLYTIGIYLKKFTPDEAIQIVKKNNIVDIYNKGRKTIDKKIGISKVLYKKIIENKIDTKNETYNETIIGGIKGFFKIYDPDYEANKIKITADYPTYNNLIGKLDGIEFIEEYLKYICYENKFCNMFQKNNIEYLLYGYSEDYKELIINIFQIVLTGAIRMYFSRRRYTKVNYFK